MVMKSSSSPLHLDDMMLGGKEYHGRAVEITGLRASES